MLAHPVPPVWVGRARQGGGEGSFPLLILFLPQLFGFVFACYVSKVFLEEEDSCKYVGPPRKQKSLVAGHPVSSAPWTGARTTSVGGSPGSAPQ